MPERMSGVTHSIPYFKNDHLKEDIYVLGSGSTLSYIKPTFFINKVVVATNSVAERLDLYRLPVQVYTHTHYHEDALSLGLKYSEHWFFSPQGDRGYAGEPPAESTENIIFYDHKPTDYNFDPDQAWPDNPFSLIVGSTSIHGSMHLAAHMGARTIILVGADCGTLDGETNHAGHQLGDLGSTSTEDWLSRWEIHLRKMKQKLRKEYPGLEIYSLNPFLNLNLEGHRWKGTVS